MNWTELLIMTKEPIGRLDLSPLVVLDLKHTTFGVITPNVCSVLRDHVTPTEAQKRSRP